MFSYLISFDISCLKYNSVCTFSKLLHPFIFEVTFIRCLILCRNRFLCRIVLIGALNRRTLLVVLATTRCIAIGWHVVRHLLVELKLLIWLLNHL
jgi:hypothetical protein